MKVAALVARHHLHARSTAFRHLIVGSVSDVSLGCGGRSPTQPQGCEPCEDTSSNWRAQTCDQDSERPQHEKGSTRTDDGRYHNEKHWPYPEIQFRRSDKLPLIYYHHFVSSRRHRLRAPIHPQLRFGFQDAAAVPDPERHAREKGLKRPFTLK
jgi:hypothetical protein